MQKISVLLICYAAMSTSILMKSMKEAAIKNNIDLEIMAVPFSEFKDYLDGVDVVLLGPQIKHAKSEIEEKTKVPIGEISVIEYGRIQGESVLRQALALKKK